jgi:hypothetical protein
MPSKFDFLQSTRFWAMVIGAVSIYLQTKGFIGEPEMILVATIMGGFTVVRTVDRIGDKKVEAAILGESYTTEMEDVV